MILGINKYGLAAMSVCATSPYYHSAGVPHLQARLLLPLAVTLSKFPGSILFSFYYYLHHVFNIIKINSYNIQRNNESWIQIVTRILNQLLNPDRSSRNTLKIGHENKNHITMKPNEIS